MAVTNQKLAGDVTGLFLLVCGFARSWAVPLIDPAMDNQPELRNRLFVILAYGLF